MYDERAVELLIERKAIEDVFYRYVSSIDVKDYAGMRATLAEDAVMHYPDAPAVHGADAIVKFVEEKGLDKSFRHRLVNVYQVDIDLERNEAQVLSYQLAHLIGDNHPDTVMSVVARSRDK